MSDFVFAKLTDAGYEHKYIPASTRETRLPKDFYPYEAYGPANSRKDGHGLLLTLHIVGIGTFKADIDKKKNFRIREEDVVQRFYDLFGLRNRSFIVIERVGETEYFIYPQRNR